MNPPPTGTITFFFTDIEGSTRLWERYPEAMGRALHRHNELLQQVIVAHGGYIFKTVGDAFLAAFHTAPEALVAALAAQHLLLAEPWEGGFSLRVRVALHTGEAEQREGDYFGPALNRIARLSQAGHGGQILLSMPTAALVRETLPDGAWLLDLGERRLKDLSRPEHIFQLVAPGLPETFPPLKTVEAHPPHLPAQPTPFIKRAREVAGIEQLLRKAAVRLLTLTGPGGTGKTRLSLQVGANLIEQFEDGVYFVPLAPLREAALLPSTIAQVLGVKEDESLKGYLREKALLLILDNFEQISDAAPQVAELLAAAPKLKIMVTSRILLRLYGEHEFQVPPLALPNPLALPPLEQMTQYEAVRLFIERAQAVRPTFTVTNDNAPAVADLCARLDGLPLAIELAAARVKLLSPEAILARLRKSTSLQLLTGGARDLPARQQTLRGAIEWSYTLLDPVEQRLFRQLGVFVGGCTIEAAERIVGSEGEITDDLLSLVDKSLLRQEPSDKGEPRFWMLETLREYALEQLEATGEKEALQARHAQYFLALAERLEVVLWGPAQEEAFEHLEWEHDNLRAVLDRVAQGGEIEVALRLAAALWHFWRVRGHIREGEARLLALLALPEATAPTMARARALNAAWRLASYRGNYAPVRALCEESLSIWQTLGDKAGIAEALHGLGFLAWGQGDAVSASEWMTQALALSRELGDKHGIAQRLNILGEIARGQGEYERAAAFYEESLALHTEQGNKGGMGSVRFNLAYVAYRQGELERAAPLFQACMLLFQEQGDTEGMADALAALAGVAHARGDAWRAAALFGAEAQMRHRVGAAMLPADQAEYDRNVAAVRDQLDEATFAAAWAEGQRMAEAQAIAYALEKTP